MKYYLFVLPLLLFFAVQSCLAQDIKKKGFVVLNNNDTLHGWIDYPTTQKSMNKITFYQDSISSSPTKYSISDLCYFEITGYDSYVRAVVPETVPLNTIVSNIAGSEDTSITQKVWLRIVITGDRLSLFQWRNEHLQYYLKESTGDYIQLQLKTTNEQEYERELPLYKNQLTFFAVKYGLANERISRTIDNARYDEDDLRK